MGGALDWRTLPAGRELDALVADAMEPRATLRVITAHEARLEHWGADPNAWTWYSVSYVTSPDGWWQAEIGTDHGAPGSDHQPVRWFVSHERQPSTNMADAWLVVERMHAARMAAGGGMGLTLNADGSTTVFCAVSAYAVDDVTAATAPLAIVRAALAATEARP